MNTYRIFDYSIADEYDILCDWKDYDTMGQFTDDDAREMQELEIGNSCLLRDAMSNDYANITQTINNV